MTDRTDERPMDTTDDELDADAGGTDALDDTENRPAGPDYGASPLDDETPGSQGEVESGSEGDFGSRDETRI